MATKVPVSVENIAFERLDLSRHYLVVDCDFTCFIVLNPSGSVPSEGTDICALHVGAWQIDAWTLLTKKDFPNQAGFSACLVWDKTLVVEGSTSAPHVVESDIDTANSISTLKGQPVNITGFSMPSGEALPVSLNLNSDDGDVDSDNPLPVRDYRQRCFGITVGTHYSIETFKFLGFKQSEPDASGIVVFSGVPVTFRGVNGDGWIAYDRGVISQHGAGSANVGKYNSAEFWVTLRYNSVEEVLVSVSVGALYTPWNNANAPALSWQGNVTNGTMSV